ncbi:hypothetical protein V5799_008095 [Amblyomma americanum]|uniref:Uncharacterized protein n=1 Tax=Amblyomma americanum TaxID=6943 RepID=A0AAQ4FEB9_AMBAM
MGSLSSARKGRRRDLELETAPCYQKLQSVLLYKAVKDISRGDSGSYGTHQQSQWNSSGFVQLFDVNHPNGSRRKDVKRSRTSVASKIMNLENKLGLQVETE